MADYILALDQGTTGTTVLVVDHDANVVGKGYCEFPQHFPRAGWVEHKPADIWGSTLEAMDGAFKAAGIAPGQVAAIGITNQRETAVLWDRETLESPHNAIVWQCRRTADICRELKERGLEATFKEKTGLVLDPYFSGTKLTWYFRNLPAVKRDAEAGKLAFGTVDSYLVARLTGGAEHVTDVSNASRTLLMDLRTLDWDAELCRHLEVPQAVLPRIVGNSGVLGKTRGVPGLPDGIPVAGMAGDQQAALFGQICFAVGDTKCTYGTGSFTLSNIGHEPLPSAHGLLTTVAWQLAGKTSYAFEGSAFVAGAAVQWLRDGLKLIKSAPDIEPLARSVPDSGGVVFVPALVGLGAPHWRPDARGAFLGLTRGTTAAHMARAVLEGIAFINHDVMKAMEEDLGRPLENIRVDGGAAANDLLMQIQADVMRSTILRPRQLETTALGAAFLAGMGVGYWADTGELRKVWSLDASFAPQVAEETVAAWLAAWHGAVDRA